MLNPLSYWGKDSQVALCFTPVHLFVCPSHIIVASLCKQHLLQLMMDQFMWRDVKNVKKNVFYGPFLLAPLFTASYIYLDDDVGQTYKFHVKVFLYDGQVTVR